MNCVFRELLRYQKTDVAQTMELFKLLLTTVVLVFAAHQLVRLVSWYMKRRKLVKLVNKIPGPKSYPFFGTVWELIGIPRHGEMLN
jgi:hypothetical protein